MVLWSTQECLIASAVYCQSFQKAKYKVNADGKMKATKANGTVLAFYKELVEKLKEDGYNRSVEAIKGKEKDFVEWASTMSAYIKQSGNACLEGKYYTIVTPASLEEEVVAKQIMENFYSAFHGTTKMNPEILDTGDKADDYSINAGKENSKVQKDSKDKEDGALFKKYINLRIQKEQEGSSEILESDDADVRQSKKKKLEKELEYQDANTREKQSIAYG